MNTKRAAVMLMAKMALADGEVVPEERDFLRDMIRQGPDKDVDDLLAKAKPTPIRTLIEHITNYADRFFVAVHAFAVAHVDEDYDPNERSFYRELVYQLGITTPDRRLIRRSQVAGPFDLPARLEELFRQSSFAIA